MHILVLGYRWGLIQEIQKRNIPFAVWVQTKPKRKDINFPLFIQNFPKNRHQVTSVFTQQYSSTQAFTHVIACVESGVVLASELRAFLGVSKMSKATSLRCHNKRVMKSFLSRKGVPMAKFLMAPQNAQLLVKTLGLPCVSKKTNLSGGKSLEIHKDMKSVQSWANQSRLFESYIEGSEASVESLIHEKEIVFENVTQYLQNGEVNVLPPFFSQDLMKELSILSRKIIGMLGIAHGMTHIEFFLTKDQIFFGEIALRPPGGYIMELVELAYGFSPWAAYLSVELGETPDIHHQSHAYAASVMNHQVEQGEYRKPHQWDRLIDMKGLAKARHVVKPGAKMSKRSSVSDISSYVLLFDKSAQTLQNMIEETQNVLRDF